MPTLLTPAQLAERLGLCAQGISKAARRRGIKMHGANGSKRTLYEWPDGPIPAPRGRPALASPAETNPPRPPQPPMGNSNPPRTARAVPAPIELPEEDEGRAYTGRIRRAIFLSDIHIPEHDIFAVRAALKWIARNKPDVVILGGDILELASCSQHPGENIAMTPMLTAEIEAARAFLDSVREAAGPDAEIVYLEGNHETRLTRIVDAQNPTLAGALTLPELLDLAGRGIRWLPYGEVLNLFGSKIGFTHGLYANEHHAKKHLDTYGQSIVYGHTHRAQFYTKGFAGNRLRGSFGAPCLRSLRVKWMKGPTGWSQGFVLAHVFDDGHFTTYTVLMDRQRFVEGGVLYDGRAP